MGLEYDTYCESTSCMTPDTGQEYTLSTKYFVKFPNVLLESSKCQTLKVWASLQIEKNTKERSVSSRVKQELGSIFEATMEASGAVFENMTDVLGFRD